MPSFELPYGHETVSLHLPQQVQVDWIEPAEVEAAPDPAAVVRQALANPVDGHSLELYRGVKAVAIAVNDKTRPVPHDVLLPPLLDALHNLGIPTSAITFLIATGTHQPMPPEEFPRILPQDICDTYRIISHNCDDQENLVARGQTSRGTQVLANRSYLDADLRIVVGNIELHHFAGFSGGYKTAAIGLTGRATITNNHAMLAEPGARIGEYANNPLRQDIEEIGDLLGRQLALNAILNQDKKIVRAVFGSPRAVMQAGIPLSQQASQVGLRSGRYDLVIASVGGAPKDINFYQSQKGLTHASLFTQDGGVIILAAECPEGTGSPSYEEFMQGVSSPEEVFRKFRKLGFRVGPHKAFQVARELDRLQIILVSQIPPSTTSQLLLTPASSLDEAVSMAQEMLSTTPLEEMRVAVLPRATNTIPVS